MEILRAIILGVVQGIGEFLPISSSGHLVIVGDLLTNVFKMGSEQSQGQALLENVVLHLGTLLSILIVYRREVWKLRLQPRVCLNIVIASIPAGILGILFKDYFEVVFAKPWIAGLCLFGTAGMLVLGQRLERSEYPYEDLPPLRAFAIGLFQAVALLPGISRSGSTISGGLLNGLQRASAGAFSFLMAIPVIGGAALLEFKDVLEGKLEIQNPVPLVVGAVTSFVVGWIALQWLVKLIAQGKLHWFAYYCAAVGTLTVVWHLFQEVSAVSAAAG